MGLIDCSVPGLEGKGTLPIRAPNPPLHRVGIVRRSQGISRRTVARHLGTDVKTVRREEQSSCDMPLTRLYQWRDALDVPIAELLTDCGDPLAAPILRRAQLVRVMKTALSILEQTKESPVRRMAETLIEQLTQVMPELEGVGPWHTVGKRRRRDELGVAAQRRLSEDVFVDLVD